MKMKAIVLGLCMSVSISAFALSPYSPSAGIVNQRHLVEQKDTPDVIAITKEYAMENFGDSLNGPSILDYVKVGILKKDAAKDTLYPSLNNIAKYVIYGVYGADEGSMILTKSGVDVKGDAFSLSGVYVFSKGGNKYKVGIIYYTKDIEHVTHDNEAILVYPVS